VEEITCQETRITFKKYLKEMKTYHQQQNQEQDLMMHVCNQDFHKPHAATIYSAMTQVDIAAHYHLLE
jgi:hypothetical protein